eukprot:gb/GFBE01049819.1/.p1 GENE.gb/GFBE01049819.1/~~gb/GFBE01049819.1/.p1  ORF type:complete len:344 (+),score=49.22 gb/GFBE01049819.1/:1-1032(+)
MSFRAWRLHRLVICASITNVAAEHSRMEVDARGNIFSKPARVDVLAKSTQKEHGTGAVVEAAVSEQMMTSEIEQALQATCTQNGCKCKEPPREESFGTGCKIEEGTCRVGCEPKWSVWDYTTNWAPDEVDNPCYTPTLVCGGVAKEEKAKEKAATAAAAAPPEATQASAQPAAPTQIVRPPKPQQELPIRTPHPQDFCRGGQLSSPCPEDQEATEGLSLAPFGEDNSDPCADLSSTQSQPASLRAKCTGFHRCKLKGSRSFRQCQYKPHSSMECQSGSSCVPLCRGRRLGEVGDDCTRRPVSECLSGYVVRSGIAIQCRVHQHGNPTSLTDFCEDDHICGIEA